jgi:hypothetical protein
LLAVSSRQLFRLSPWQGERIEVRGWSFADARGASSNPHPPPSLGGDALIFNSSGSGNVAVGNLALESNTPAAATRLWVWKHSIKLRAAVTSQSVLLLVTRSLPPATLSVSAMAALMWTTVASSARPLAPDCRCRRLQVFQPDHRFELQLRRWHFGLDELTRFVGQFSI